MLLTAYLYPIIQFPTDILQFLPHQFIFRFFFIAALISINTALYELININLINDYAPTKESSSDDAFFKEVKPALVAYLEYAIKIVFKNFCKKTGKQPRFKRYAGHSLLEITNGTDCEQPTLQRRNKF